jgi:signal transduction histidine kinase
MIRILIVDDNRSICKALSQGLSSLGFDVDAALDGSTGLQLAKQKKYDVLINDISLPDMNGFDVIDKIQSENFDVISIVITGNSSIENTLEALHLDVSDYLEKPLALENVHQTILRGLEKREQNRRELDLKIDRMLRERAQDHFGLTTSELLHQISNPLMAIRGNADLAMYNLDNARIVKTNIIRIIHACDQIVRINKKIMACGSQIKEKKKEMNIKTIIQDCLLMFKELLQIKAIVLETGLTPLDRQVHGNSFKFEQIMKNLILNAIDAMDEGHEKKLTITGESTPQSISISIRDTGCGIPEASMDKIFLPYSTSKPHGTGLGLHVARKIVHEMGGRITVASHGESGATFLVHLPNFSDHSESSATNIQ